MRIARRILFGLVIGTALAAGAWAQAPAGGADRDIVQVWNCSLEEGTTELQVEQIVANWVKAARQMPGGEKANARVLFPVAVTNSGDTDFLLVLSVPTFSDWGKFWDAFEDDSPAAKADDAAAGKFECPDSAIWETVIIK